MGHTKHPKSITWKGDTPYVSILLCNPRIILPLLEEGEKHTFIEIEGSGVYTNKYKDPRARDIERISLELNLATLEAKAYEVTYGPEPEEIHKALFYKDTFPQSDIADIRRLLLGEELTDDERESL